MSRSNPPKPPAENNDGRNQYIPSFIAAKPFYADTLDDSDYLQHQRSNAEPKDTLDKAKWYDRGKKSGPAATKYRKGACENCGSASHKTKECLYRPRKTGAKWTGKDIKADEIVEDVSLGWDAKRDRWNGYDPQDYSEVIRDYEELEAMKKAASGTPDQKECTNNEADDRYAEETDMGRSQPTSTRQLRLREDTAKYLINLDLDSAKYDPKTRSMDQSASATNGQGNQVDVSDGFIRPSEAEAFERAQKYAWETQESAATSNTQKLHLQANPTEGALLLKKKESADAEAKAARAKYLADKYGDASASASTPGTSTKPPAPKPSILSSERYIEYDSTGKPKGQLKSIPRSKYPEDIFQNNHTAVWGSWWRNFTWGYACCHSTVKNSYCTGEQGKRAWEEAEGLRTGQALLAEKEGNNNEEERKEMVENDTASDSKKRTIAQITSGGVTEEEMETYKRNKLSASDPMARMLGRDELMDKT